MRREAARHGAGHGQGDSLPDELAEAFEALRPSCQRDYAARVAGATTPKQRERHVKRVAELALAWKARHPEAGRRAGGAA